LAIINFKQALVNSESSRNLTHPGSLLALAATYAQMGKIDFARQYLTELVDLIENFTYDQDHLNDQSQQRPQPINLIVEEVSKNQ